MSPNSHLRPCVLVYNRLGARKPRLTNAQKLTLIISAFSNSGFQMQIIRHCLWRWVFSTPLSEPVWKSLEMLTVAHETVLDKIFHTISLPTLIFFLSFDYKRIEFSHVERMATIMLRNNLFVIIHDDVIRRKYFTRKWSFLRRIHRSAVNSPHKGQWRGALMFSLICAWINGWVNNRGAGDLRRHHYDVMVMFLWKIHIGVDLSIAMVNIIIKGRYEVMTWDYFSLIT